MKSIRETMERGTSFVLDISLPWQWKPGFIRSDMCVRVWWLCFAASVHNRGDAELIMNPHDWMDDKGNRCRTLEEAKEKFGRTK
jgi:hypothetical protein